MLAVSSVSEFLLVSPIMSRAVRGTHRLIDTTVDLIHLLVCYSSFFTSTHIIDHQALISKFESLPLLPHSKSQVLVSAGRIDVIVGS